MRRTETCSIIDASNMDLLYYMAIHSVIFNCQDVTVGTPLKKKKTLVPAGNQSVTPWSPSRQPIQCSDK